MSWTELQDEDDAPLVPPMVTLQILGGRKEKIRPGDVLGALTGEAGFTREQVGKITVTDQSTYVAVARNIAREAVRKLSAGKVKGKTVKVRALEDQLTDSGSADATAHSGLPSPLPDKSGKPADQTPAADNRVPCAGTVDRKPCRARLSLMCASSCTTIMRRNSGGICLNMVATRISRLVLRFAPCTREMRGVRAQCVPDDMQLAVERHLAQLPGVAQISAFEFQHVVIQRLVGAHIVRQRIFLPATIRPAGLARSAAALARPVSPGSRQGNSAGLSGAWRKFRAGASEKTAHQRGFHVAAIRINSASNYPVRSSHRGLCCPALAV